MKLRALLCHDGCRHLEQCVREPRREVRHSAPSVFVLCQVCFRADLDLPIAKLLARRSLVIACRVLDGARARLVQELAVAPEPQAAGHDRAHWLQRGALFFLSFPMADACPPANSAPSCATAAAPTQATKAAFAKIGDEQCRDASGTGYPDEYWEIGVALDACKQQCEVLPECAAVEHCPTLERRCALVDSNLNLKRRPIWWFRQGNGGTDNVIAVLANTECPVFMCLVKTATPAIAATTTTIAGEHTAENL